MAQARKMAEHPDVVERVIEESTDADPPTKAKTLQAIRDAQEARYPWAVGLYPELADTDIFPSKAKVVMLAEQIQREPHRLENLRLHIAAKHREKEPGYKPPTLRPLPSERPRPMQNHITCPNCGHNFKENER